MIISGNPLLIIYVRALSEYEVFHIENSIHISVQDLRKDMLNLVRRLER